jgi:hypothetical protein
MKAKPPNPLTPPATLLVKLGSIAVHADEMLSPGGHAYDKVALEQLLQDPEVKEWIARMDALAFLPKKRKP